MSGYYGLTAHIIKIHREKAWPRQWIGMCSCGRGIRCNSRADAESFFKREGCR